MERIFARRVNDIYCGYDGLFAESFTEHLTENKKEREFIISLKEDLMADTAFLNKVIPLNHIQFEKLDRLYMLLEQVVEGKPVSMNRLYYLNFRYGSGLMFFIPNKRTISQIKSTGAFALIKNKASRDNLTNYDNYNETALAINGLGLRERTDALNYLGQKIFN